MALQADVIERICFDAANSRQYDATALRNGWETFAHEIMSGSRRGAAAWLVRAGLSAIEPFYAGGMSVRNRFYDRRASHSAGLGRPVISIGNITTGGTGKTPMVRWLSDRLRQGNHHVAILSRGYGSAPGTLGDEQIMLERLLNGTEQNRIIIAANPNRLLAARQVLQEHPQCDVFVLDDGFQHRAVARNLDIVLISATNPFGYGHVLPRGMLREPLSGLRRAEAVVITHADRVDAARLRGIEDELRKLNLSAPIYRARHAVAGFRKPATASSSPIDEMPAAVQSSSVFAFCAIGSPSIFFEQLKELGARVVGTATFPDHHCYNTEDLAHLRQQAKIANAERLMTTEKDWAKIMALDGATDASQPIWRMDVQMDYFGDDESRLLELVHRSI